MEIFLPDGSSREFEHKPTVIEVAQKIGERLAKDTLGAKINGHKEIIDLRDVLENGTRLEIITTKSPEAQEVVRHSAAHVMAQAVQELWPEIKVTIGPVIEDGFYYDFHTQTPLTESDLQVIEKKMSEIIKRNDPLVKEIWSSDDAVKVFSDMGETFKKEIIDDLETSEVSIYKQGEWFDLCRGPHVQKTGQIKAFKLLSMAGAYWRGDENRESLQRIYATAFNNKEALKEYLFALEEAKKRDHRKVGKELGLFHFHPTYSPAAPFFTPKGTFIYKKLQELMQKLYIQYHYKEVITPQIFDVDLYKRSGHYDNYAENMYFTQIDEREFSLKPMNCPGHCVLYDMEKKSYRDLPWRIADFGRLHRYERSGVIHGLTRVRTFCQDDAHIFCTLEQMQQEIEGFMTMLNETYKILGMKEYRVYLSTRPEKRMGSDEVWDKAEGALEKGLRHLNIPYEVNEGDGAFYGPKLDIMFVDALKRPWQLGTLQCDFNMPESFALSYVGEDNGEHRPVLLHRAILGSLERFIGVYLEHTAGRLPTWLCPHPVVILNVTDRVKDYCEKLLEDLRTVSAGVYFDSRSEKLNKKIREAQLLQIPYMVIVGDKEAEQEVISLRLRSGETHQGVKPEVFKKDLSEEINNKLLESSFLESSFANEKKEVN